MIIGLSGKKNAGKNTVSNVLHGIVLKKMGMVKDFTVNDEGKLWVLTTDASGTEGWGEFDVERRDSEFKQWAEANMYPYIKMYSFADALKWMAIELFDVPPECCFGTEDQKNQKHEHLRWENLPIAVRHIEWGHPNAFGPMTAREFLQVFGTDICRGIWEPIWVNKCIKDIQREGTELAIVTDVRFPNEVEAIEKAGGITLRLTRQVFDDQHTSETALDNYSFKDYLDNNNCTVDSLIPKVREAFQSFSRRINDSNIR